MKIALIAFDQTGLIRAGITGQITCTDFPSDGTNPLAAVLGQSWQANRVSLDMSAVPYIDSAAVGWLINCQREATKAGGNFVVHSVQPQVKQLLDLLKISKVVKMADNETSACELAAGGGEVIATKNAPEISKVSAETAVLSMLDHAIAIGASDIFFVANEYDMSVLVRRWGTVSKLAALPPEQGKRAIAHIRANAGMDTTEKRRPVDGRWIYKKQGSNSVDLRINAIPTMHGEDFAIRLLVRGSAVLDLDQLGMSATQLATYGQMISSPSGLILITGPTGSGKTATLYSSLVRLNDGKRKINTIEDPVEYQIEGLRQSQINPQIDLGFAEMLRGVLRQNPDVIMIGEIRDEETAKTVVHAANSGMLVLATLHASSAAGAVQSMRSLGVNPHFLGQALRGVVAQRLVRPLCPSCKTNIDLGEDAPTYRDIEHLLPKGESKKLWMPKGCLTCDQSGYAGRMGLFEVLKVDSAMRERISDGASTSQIAELGGKAEQISFQQAALLTVASGLTSTEEIFRVVPPEQLL